MEAFSMSMSVFAIICLWKHNMIGWIVYRHFLFEHFSGLVALSAVASLYFWSDYRYKAATITRHANPTVEDDYIEATTVHL